VALAPRVSPPEIDYTEAMAPLSSSHPAITAITGSGLSEQPGFGDERRSSGMGLVHTESFAHPHHGQLGTHVAVHDRQQVEFRINYDLGIDTGPQMYRVDAYLFVSKNIGVNATNYSRDQFYGDVTALMRLDAPSMPLERLANRDQADSPLGRLVLLLDRFRTEPRPPPSKPATVQVKLYAYLFTEAIWNERQRLMRLLRDTLREPAGGGSRGAFEQELVHGLGRIRRALGAFRRVRAELAPFEELCHRSLPEALRMADEYMSLFLEEQLAEMVWLLDGEPRLLDGSCFAARMRLLASELAWEESRYRRDVGYLTMADPKPDQGEYFTYRGSVLKKTVHQALYLDARQTVSDTFLRNAVAAVGAALAAIWAFAAQLPTTFSGLSSNTQLFVFASAVIAYVTKDRIKSLSSDYLAKRLKRFDHTSWLGGSSLSAVGLGMLRARLRESMRFLRHDDVPDDVVKLRLQRRTVLHTQGTQEEVIHYRKELVVDATERQSEPFPPGYWVRDILRLNVRHFLVRLDDPVDQVIYFDRQRLGFRTAEMAKVYHLNVVLDLHWENGHGESLRRLEHLRIVLNKEGIVRVEHVGKVRPVATKRPSRSFKLPIRLRSTKKPTAPPSP
jgi:hypothetical protein